MDYDLLCPFCDEAWPKIPSPKLVRLKATVMKHAHPFPRLGNPFGMRTDSFTRFIQLCQQHRYETHTIPDGLRHGWPRVIDFDVLPSRLELIKPQLATIVDDPSQSPFFRKAQDDIASLGAVFVSSMQGQLRSFPCSQPG